MDNQTLLKLSLAVSLIGIFLLLLLSNIIQPRLIEIKEINKLLLNQKIQVHGHIDYIKDYNTFQILTIKDKTGKIPVLISENLNINLTVNQTITIIGRLKEYNNKLQIQADKIIE